MSAEASQVTAQAEPTAIAEVNTAVAKFDRVAAGIVELQSKYKGVLFDVTTAKGMKDACEARAAIRAPRYEVEKVRKECKAPILALGKEIDARAAAITTELLALESPIDAQVKAEELRKEEERKARIEAERKRVAEIHARIDEIKTSPAGVANRDAAKMASAIRHMVALEIGSSFQEFQATAIEAREYALTKLRQMLADREAFEAEQERLRIEREELARQRAEQEQANIEARRQIALAEAEAKRKREAEEAAATAERKRLLDEQLAKLRAQAEEQERAAKEQRENAAAEQRRIDQENERQAELGRARWGEIQAIGHQVMIATVGRKGVRTGGTRECIVETLAETEAWTVTEDKFGPLLGAALSARTNACDQIRTALAAFDQAAQQSHFREQLQRQQDALAAERAEFERRQAELAKPVAQVATATEPDSEPLLTTEPHPDATIEAVAFQPSAEDLIGLVSAEYGVGPDMAGKWLRDAFAPVLV